MKLLLIFFNSGKYVMSDLHQVGGTPGVLKYLLEKGIIDGDVMTVTSKTMAENLAAVPHLDPNQVRWRRRVNEKGRRGR